MDGKNVGKTGGGGTRAHPGRRPPPGGTKPGDPWDGSRLADGYEIDGNGLHLMVMIPEDKRERHGGASHFMDRVTCGPIWVSAFTRNHLSEGWGRQVRWIDRDGESHEDVIPESRLHEGSTNLVQELANKGVALVRGKGKELMNFLAGTDPVKRLRYVSRVGWVDREPEDRPVYILPNDVIRAEDGTGDECVFKPEVVSPITPAIHAMGTLDEWRECVAPYAKGNPILTFCLAAAFAPPLLRHLGAEGGGFHLFGNTSRGKTTALQLAASVWGCGAAPTTGESLVQTWNATVNGLEAMAASANDCLLLLDEAGQKDDKDKFGKMIYDLTSGTGKATLTSDRQARDVRKWRVLFLSTGESSSYQFMKEAGVEPRGGQMLRLIDVHARDDIIVDTGGEEPAKFVDDIKDNCANCYGTAGPAFLRFWIGRIGGGESMRGRVDGESGNPDYQKLLDELTDRLTPTGSDAAKRRGIRRIALVQLAGNLALEAGVIPGRGSGNAGITFDEDDIRTAAEHVRDSWLGRVSTLRDAERGADKLRDFILRNRGRFWVVGRSDPPSVGEIVGFVKRRKTDGGIDEDVEYFFTRESLEKACRGFDVDSVTEELKRIGALACGERGRNNAKRRIPGLPDLGRVYVVRAAFIGTVGSGALETGANRKRVEAGSDLAKTPPVPAVGQVTGHKKS